MAVGRFQRLTYVVTFVAALLNVYVATYPSFNAERCQWTLANRAAVVESLSPLSRRILDIPVVGDLYDQYVVRMADIDAQITAAGGHPADVRLLAVGDPQIKGNWPSTPYITRLDTFGNDYYLGHIYRLMKSRLKPTHVSIMGDLFSSQWILDREFFNRSQRYIKRLFPRPQEHVGDLLDFMSSNDACDWEEFMRWFQQTLAEDKFEYGYEDVYDWTDANLAGEPLFINISGNHDIGNGDVTYQHMARFFKIMGKDNYYIEYDTKTDHPWRIVVLNSLAVDGPFVEPLFVDYTWNFIGHLAARPYNGSTVLLTHVPFYKDAGLCVDEPLVEYFDADNSKLEYMWGKIKSENHIQPESSQRILDAVFGNGKPGVILTGHDHEGCQTVYNRLADRWEPSKEVQSGIYVKEIVVRSIMGEYGGNTGLMTGHFNGSEWEFDYNLCPFKVQHVWWVARVSVVVALLMHTVGMFR